MFPLWDFAPTPSHNGRQANISEPYRKSACISIFDSHNFIYLFSRIFPPPSLFVDVFLFSFSKVSQVAVRSMQETLCRRIKLFHLLYFSFIHTPQNTRQRRLWRSLDDAVSETKARNRKYCIAFQFFLFSLSSQQANSQSYFIFTCHETKNFIYERYNQIWIFTTMSSK